MSSKVILASLLMVLVHVTSASNHNVDCLNPKVTYVSCPKSGGTPGGESNVPTSTYHLLECCNDYLYAGPGSGHYEFPGGPFTLTINEFFSNGVIEAIIKKVFCNPKGSCKHIHVKSDEEVPINLKISGPRFTITTKNHKGGDISFTVDRPDCDCGSDRTGVIKDKQCDTANGWEKHGDYCYKVNDNLLKWSDAEAACVGMGGHLAAPQTKAELEYLDGLMMAANKELYLGSHTVDAGTTWQNTDGTSVNPSLWKEGRPTYLFDPDATCSCLTPFGTGPAVYNCICNWADGLGGICKK